MRALEMLNYLGALNDDGELTELGRQMAACVCFYNTGQCWDNVEESEFTNPLLIPVYQVFYGNLQYRQVDKNMDHTLMKNGSEEQNDPF
ncbi:hypothetical protein PsorP6_011311 [Peronosclerospora sorghi]|uniref:Uncharacterized protein n=1 Tax=Peronosclerospora sorghi TaxID=230839 RepID=A0ACC0WLI3_9STRA|nr:hypothetical protein PsorP6_011311 [Peronosclerospora sorghi]